MPEPTLYVSTKVDPKAVKKLPKLTPEVRKKLRTAKARLITDTTAANSLNEHRKASSKNLATLAKVYRSNKSALARFQTKESTSTAAPKMTFTDSNGKPRSVRAVNRDAMVRDALVARALLSSRTNQARVYADALGIVMQRAKSISGLSSKLKDLPKEFDVNQSSISVIDNGLANLIDLVREHGLWKVKIPDSPPANRPGQCRDEEGTGNGGDSTDCAPQTPSANGLLRNNNWPLKLFTTCVRNQGSQRGTCPSFSTIAAMECCIAVKKNRWVNLSEQDLYKHQRHDWFPFDDYDDGFAPPVSLLFQLLTGYVFPWERDWDYNVSSKRQDDEVHHTYSHSCDLYTNTNCSDTNHQSHRTCYQVDEEVQRTITRTVSTWVEDVVTVVEDVVNWLGSLIGQETHTEIWGHWVEKTVTEVVTDIVSTTVCVYDTNIPGSSGFKITNVSIFWDPLTNGQVGVSLAKLYLSARVPVIYCLWAMPSFKKPDKDGYVIYAGPNESPGKDAKGNDLQVSDTGHCVCITGFVDNADLPAGAPQGSGGGYFIVKNSWGTRYADSGFVYVPYDWAVQWGQVMCTINTISP